MNITELINILKSDHYFTDADKDAFFGNGGIVFDNYDTNLRYRPVSLIQHFYIRDDIETRVMLIQAYSGIIKLLIKREGIKYTTNNMKSITDYTFTTSPEGISKLHEVLIKECNIKIKTPLEYCLELFGPASYDTINRNGIIIIPDGKFVVIIDTTTNSFYIHGITELWVSLTFENLDRYCSNYDEGIPKCRCNYDENITKCKCLY